MCESTAAEAVDDMQRMDVAGIRNGKRTTDPRSDPHRGPHKSGPPHRGPHKADHRRPQRDPHREPHRNHTDTPPQREVARHCVSREEQRIEGSRLSAVAFRLMFAKYGPVRESGRFMRRRRVNPSASMAWVNTITSGLHKPLMQKA